jgi:hypothetical protein
MHRIRRPTLLAIGTGLLALASCQGAPALARQSKSPFVPPDAEWKRVTFAAATLPDWRVQHADGTTTTTRRIQATLNRPLELELHTDRTCTFEIPAMRVRATIVPEHAQSVWFVAVQCGEFEVRVRSGTDVYDGNLIVNESTVNETEQYILDSIREWVWSGYYQPDEVQDMVGDLLEDGVDEPRLRAAVPEEFAKKTAREASWPEVTDCDRLDRAFAELETRGIVALQNAGTTMSDGLDEVDEARSARGADSITGYCFFHAQDLERALAGHGLLLAFGAFRDDDASKVEVGRTIRTVLQQHGLATEWSGDPKTRIQLPKIDWQRRLARARQRPDPPPSTPPPPGPQRPWWRFW